MTHGTNPDPSKRILIVGAGPAGLSTAMYLRKKGYTNLTVLEKEAVVGGKCRSFFHEGRAYDLGANLHTPRYTTIRGLGAELGLTERELLDRRIVNLSQEEFESLTDANLLERLMVRGGTSLYTLARELTGIDRHGYAGLRRGVRRPFGEWLDRHALDPFIEVFAALFIAFGYGEMTDLPAAYALKFFDPIHINSAVRVILGEELRTTHDWAEGFQELWERVDSTYELDVQRSVTIVELHRSPRGVQVVYERDGKRITSDHDALVLAMPFEQTRAFMDTSAEEERLFAKIRYNDYYTTAGVLGNVQENVTYVYPYARVFTPGYPTIFYPPVGDDPNGVHMFYAYGGEGIDEAVVRKNIEDIVARPEFNGDLDRFLTTKHWRYFPHVDSDEMQGGFFEDFEALQGQWNTFYTGELLSFSLTELIARYSEDLVARRF